MAGSHPETDMNMIVTWGDCDAAGISYYARTFDWFTNGRLQFLAANDLPYMTAFHHAGISLVCLTADCKYARMLRPEQPIVVRTSLAELTRTRMTFVYRIFKQDGELAAEGQTSHAYVDRDGMPFNMQKRHPQLWLQLADKWRVFQEDRNNIRP